MQFIQSAILVFIGAVIGSLLTYWGRIGFAKRTEYYRQRPLVKEALENTISKVRQHNFPWILVRDNTIDGLITDIVQVMPYCKRIGFKKKWNEYRYDKNMANTVPNEYEQSTDIGRRLITERLHNLISKL
jgi:hypothetical protein